MFLIFFISLIFQSTNSFLLTNDPYFKVFLSKSTFLTELNQQLHQAIVNQTLPSHIPILHNNSISSDLQIVQINLTITDIFIGNQSTFNETTLNLVNSSLALNFSLAYRYKTTYIGSNSNGTFSLQGCDLQLDYKMNNGTIKVNLTLLNISSFNPTFEKNTSMENLLMKLINVQQTNQL